MRNVKWLVMLLLCSMVSQAMAKEKTTARRVAQDPAPAAGEVAPAIPEALPARRVPERNLFALTHAVTLRPDGMLEGNCTGIDPTTLQEFPVPGIDVIFVQNGRVVTSARTNASGTFVARGLTAQAVYSVIARNNQWFSANSVAILSSDAGTDNQTASVAKFSSMIKKLNANIVYAPSLSLGMIPYGDFAATGIAPGASNNALPGGAAFGQGGGGGGGMGGGGGIGGGGRLGMLGAIGAAAAAIGIAASDDDDQVASPF